MKASTSLAILGTAIHGADAFFRMPCRGLLGIARLDPLVNPGEIAHHAHNIHGSNGQCGYRVRPCAPDSPPSPIPSSLTITSRLQRVGHL